LIIRGTSELNRKPVPFSQYSFPLLKFSREAISPINFRSGLWRGGLSRMMDFVLEAWISGLIESSKAAGFSARQALAAGGKTEASVRRLQRHT